MTRKTIMLKQYGISLYTLLAAVVVLGVLTSVLVTSFTGSHTREQALWAMMHNIGQAANQFHLDTSCYPVDMVALWDYVQITSSAHYHRNSCDTTIPKNRWRGPYIEAMKFEGTDSVQIRKFGPEATMELGYFGSRANKKPIMVVDGINSSMAQAI